ncbi:toll-like receptor 4 [Plodia interpunctella]|uniref:toll-like receptor 4 n=1 Tax=Plodia interpunctella TaxID=58824 RepID=UPI002368829C|nr:toll-like receptor 4 [Plodia interpunctella]
MKSAVVSPTAGYIWLLLCYVQHARSNLLDEYEALSTHHPLPQFHRGLELPVELGVDRSSGCICRAVYGNSIVVCFGNYVCKRFPKLRIQSDVLRVRTTVIDQLVRGDLDAYYYLRILDIEANHQLTYIEPGIFRNMTKLEHLSISYNTQLLSIDNRTFEGLRNLKNLTMVNNGFTNIIELVPAFRPSILPSLTWLDISENSFERITAHTFLPMEGSTIRKLDLCLCRLDYIHENSFTPLKRLRELQLGENDLSANQIEKFLIKMAEEGITLTHLDLSGIGFRKQPPKRLLEVIAQSTIKWLILARNQFEIIGNDSFPPMPHIELLDLRNVLTISIGINTFSPSKFPNLKALFLNNNNLPGIHYNHLSDQLIYLDLSNNQGDNENPMYFEIGRDTFINSKQLRVLNLSFNAMKAIFDYTFHGLGNLKVLNLENGTLYYIGIGTFRSMPRLKTLNLANNPLAANQNLSSAQFEGLNELKILILKNCGIKQFVDDDNIFEMMPNITHLILKNNQLYFITPETLKPLKHLQVLDLSENLMIAWWRPLFLAAGVKPLEIDLQNNKISLFSLSMIQDMNYILENRGNETAKIHLMYNVFTCDCSTMYKTSLWLEVNGSSVIKDFFSNSQIRCSSPDIWEYKRVIDYLTSIRRLNCLVYERFNHAVVFMWTAPTLVSFIIIVIVGTFIYKYRMYLRYWLFLAKIAIGRKFIQKSLKSTRELKSYKYDAFVSYCNEDRDFISEMVSQLETNPPYLKLCIYERDFEIGSFISESVLSSINESKYVILVISNNFAKSQWCRWETQLAEYHRLFLEDGTTYDPLVLIKMGEIENKYLNTTLKYLMKTKIYHAWDESNQTEFWRKLRNVITKKV